MPATGGRGWPRERPAPEAHDSLRSDLAEIAAEMKRNQALVQADFPVFLEGRLAGRRCEFKLVPRDTLPVPRTAATTAASVKRRSSSSMRRALHAAPRIARACPRPARDHRAGIEPPLGGNRARRPCPRQAPPPRLSTLQGRRSRDAPSLHHCAVAAASTNRATSELSAGCQRPGAGSRPTRKGSRRQPAGMRAEVTPGPRGRHVETHPRARARACHRPADSPASVEGASLGLTAPWLLAADPVAGRRHPAAIPSHSVR
jgi:hypothetical protein